MSYLFWKLCDQGRLWHWKNDVRGWFKAARNFFFTLDSNRTLIWHCLIWNRIVHKSNVVFEVYHSDLINNMICSFHWKTCCIPIFWYRYQKSYQNDQKLFSKSYDQMTFCNIWPQSSPTPQNSPKGQNMDPLLKLTKKDQKLIQPSKWSSWCCLDWPGKTFSGRLYSGHI